MSSSSDSFSLSSPSSERSGGSGISQSNSSNREQTRDVGRIPIETIVKVREDPLEELAESNCRALKETLWYLRGLPFDEFTIGVLQFLKVAPTQLHPNSWAYLQAFQVLCMTVYLQPSLRAFLYFFDIRPRSLTTWLSLVSRLGINRLDAFTQSFKHFKDGFFKVVVKQVGPSHFYTSDGGHMAQMGKKNLTLFQTLRKEKAARAKAVGNTEVPNLQESWVDVHVHGGAKSKGKDVKKMQVALLGLGSSNGRKGPEAGLIELSETVVRRDIKINVSETLINSLIAWNLMLW
ncbi:Transposase putative [Vigna unguiculata]|uniref:Transposase putative n=1 Tax=Vigna unguiculata TaxID=3917 RepID=A0A4D6LMR2_VIGUN|nr:Transposase putative [Vigna unguiculata]